MRIRPLHKTPAGHWLSDDGEWLFTNYTRENWKVYQKIGLQFWSDTPYFYYSYPTLGSIIKGLEKSQNISRNRKKKK